MKPPSVQIDRLSFRHKRAVEPTLREISADIEEGKTVALMGAGGSGKSSLCFSLNGVIPHILSGTYSGTVRVQGVEVHKHRVWQMAKLVGLVLQDFDSQLFTDSVEQELAFGLEGIGLCRSEIGRRVEESLQALHLVDLRSESPMHLSGGQRQLLALAAVLITTPPVVVLDEATTDLDPTIQDAVFSLLAKIAGDGAAIVVADHKSEVAVHADEMWLLEKGKLVRSGPPGILLGDSRLLDACSVRMPGVTGLMHSLGFDRRVYTLNEATSLLSRFSVATGCGAALKPEEATYVRGGPVIRASHLAYAYPGKQDSAVEDVSLEIHAGEFAALIGHNGSGKTTVAKMLAGIYSPKAGQVVIDGREITTYSRRERAAKIGYVFQNPDRQIFSANVEEEVGFGPRQLGFEPRQVREMVAEALGVVGLAGYERHDPVLLTKGERQRVAVAAAIVTKPRILVLDEPIKGLDYRRQISFLSLLSTLVQAGHSVLLITHAMWIVAEYCSRVILVKSGRIVLDGPTRAVFRRSATLEDAGMKPTELTALSNKLGLQSVSIDSLRREIRALMSVG